MQDSIDDIKKIALNQKDEVISLRCELQENLQKAMKNLLRIILIGINIG